MVILHFHFVEVIQFEGRHSFDDDLVMMTKKGSSCFDSRSFIDCRGRKQVLTNKDILQVYLLKLGIKAVNDLKLLKCLDAFSGPRFGDSAYF